MGGRARQLVVTGALALTWSWSGSSFTPFAPGVAASQAGAADRESDRSGVAKTRRTEAAASTRETTKEARRESAADRSRASEKVGAARGGKEAKGEGASSESAVAEREGRRAASAAAPSNLAADAEAAAQEWPQIQSGVWQIEGTLKQANGRLRHWTEKTKQCQDPTVLFQGHRGRAAGKHGCTFQSTKVSGSEFKVIAECMVPKKGLATSESTVTVKSDKEFEMQIHLHTQKKDARTSQTGRWVSACSGGH